MEMEYILSDLDDTLRFGFCMGNAFSDAFNNTDGNTSTASTISNANTTSDNTSDLKNNNCVSLPRTIYLYGDLGAGKTTFTRAFVSAFAGAENAEVASPSFTLCHEYPTIPEIYHADLYRLPNDSNLPEELHELTENMLLILEWPERLKEAEREENRLELHFSIVQEENRVKMSIEELDNFENSCEKKRRIRLLIYGEKMISSKDSLKKALQNCFESKK